MAKKKTKRFDENLTEAEFKSRIISVLRQLSQRWAPKQEAIWRARVSRGVYKCELCWVVWPSSLPPLPWKKRKRKNINADHIIPVVWPDGFTTYDDWIKRCFVPSDGFQAICRECHSKLTKAENAERRNNKIKLKENEKQTNKVL